METLHVEDKGRREEKRRTVSRSMFIRVIVAFVLIASLAGGFTARNVSAETWGDFEYQLTNDGTEVEITGYLGPGGDVVIPEMIDGKPVTSIGPNAFSSYTALTSISIPSGVTSIGDSAFFDCTALTSIDVDPGNPNYASVDGVLYDEAIAFLIQCPGGKVGALTIPSSVTCVGDYALYHCLFLTSVTIPDGVTSIGQAAFMSCVSLTSMAIPYGVTTIRDMVFWGCTALESVTVPDGVTSIGDHAFQGCGLKSMTLPEGVTSIGTAAFNANAYLTSVNIPNGVTYIGGEAFDWCPSLIVMTIPASVTSMGSGVFISDTSLTAIEVNAGNPNFASIDGVLYDKAITTLFEFPRGRAGVFSVPSSVTSIGTYAFYGSIHLTSVTIPSSVTSIGHAAFVSCTAMTQMYFDGDAPTCGEQWLLYDIGLTIYYYYGATGFTTPYWEGVPTVCINPMYEVSFAQNGLGGDASGAVLTFNDVQKTYSDLPCSILAGAGDEVTYSYLYSVSAGTGKQYVLTGVNGPSSPMTVSGPVSVVGSYKTQFYLTVVSDHDTPGGSGWYDASTTATATLEMGAVEISGIQYVFSGWTVNDVLVGTSLSQPIEMDGPKIAVANWVAVIIFNPDSGAPPGSPESRTGSYEYVAPDDGYWVARITNDGVSHLGVTVIDVTDGQNVEVMCQLIKFALAGAYPTGTVYSNPVPMTAGHVYMIVLTPYGAGGSIQIVDEFTPDVLTSSQHIWCSGLGLSSGVLLFSAICLCSYFVMRVGKLAGRELPVPKVGRRRVEGKSCLPREVLKPR